MFEFKYQPKVAQWIFTSGVSGLPMLQDWVYWRLETQRDIFVVKIYSMAEKIVHDRKRHIIQ
jgi:hypothetical protein